MAGVALFAAIRCSKSFKIDLKCIRTLAFVVLCAGGRTGGLSKADFLQLLAPWKGAGGFDANNQEANRTQGIRMMTASALILIAL
jgi:hypothetical protein